MQSTARVLVQLNSITVNRATRCVFAFLPCRRSKASGAASPFVLNIIFKISFFPLASKYCTSILPDIGGCFIGEVSRVRFKMSASRRGIVQEDDSDESSDEDYVPPEQVEVEGTVVLNGR